MFLVWNQASGALDRQNAIFDESGNFLIYCTMLGVKVVNVVTNKLVRMLGRHENVRFLHATLFQVSNAVAFLACVKCCAVYFVNSTYFSIDYC